MTITNPYQCDYENQVISAQTKMNIWVLKKTCGQVYLLKQKTIVYNGANFCLSFFEDC
jgi:hypothetical protein